MALPGDLPSGLSLLELHPILPFWSPQLLYRSRFSPILFLGLPSEGGEDGAGGFSDSFHHVQIHHDDTRCHGQTLVY